MDAKKLCQELLAKTNVEINPPDPRPWDIEVLDERFYSRVLKEGSLGLGESYMEGWFTCRQLDEFLYRVFVADLKEGIYKRPRTAIKIILHHLGARLNNPGKIKKAFEVGSRHYDLGNDFYSMMLDEKMVYSCGYYKNTHLLNDAQEEKLKLICEKLELEPGMALLDIGCGWGSLLHYASQHYGVLTTGVTVSWEQAEYAWDTYQDDPNIEVIFDDYRSYRLYHLWKKFDAVVSVGMFEHVGYKNYSMFIKTAKKFMRDKNSLFLLHTIGGNKDRVTTDPWIDKYIFPDSMLPSARQIARAVQEGGLVLEDWHNFGLYYDHTLMDWYDNFRSNRDCIQELDPDMFDDTFFRMWEFYLLSCAALFRARKAQLWQIVLSKRRLEMYNSIR